MNEGRRTAGEWEFRREDYKKIKQMDRQQMERFCRNLYEQGQESAKEKGLTMDEIREAVKGVKGIGEKRASEIITVLEAKIHG